MSGAVKAKSLEEDHGASVGVDREGPDLRLGGGHEDKEEEEYQG